MSEQSRIRAAIRRAAAAARRELEDLDAAQAARLLEVYERAVRIIRADIAQYASLDGNLRREVLESLLSQLVARIGELAQAVSAQVSAGIGTAASIGATAWTPVARELRLDIPLLAEAATRFVQDFIAADGLQLSDRLWRLELGAREAVADAVRTSIVQGIDASRAAREFLARGLPLPPEIAAQLGLDALGTVQGSAAQALMRDPEGAYWKALRVMRTEINRAHGEAYRQGAAQHPDVIGERFLLSPRHPRVDICDMHARANRYGLGPGVYPVGRSPWPAHPNTLSYTEAVFVDEVSDADRAGAQSAIDWLRAQPEDVQEGVLGQHKAEALRMGVLEENEINTPWGVLRGMYEQRGITIDIG